MTPAIRRPLRRRRERGIAALMVMVFLLVVVSFAAVTLLSLSSSDLQDTTAQDNSHAALFLAESGVERASYLYSAGGVPCGIGLVPAAPIAFGRGTIQSTGVAPVLDLVTGRCRVQISGTVGTVTRTVEVELSGGITAIASSWSAANNAVIADTWNHTIPATAGSDRVLIVGVSIRNDSGQLVSITTPPVYAGQPLTLIGQATNGTSVRTELWRLVNPPTGTNQVTVTLDAAARMRCGAMSFSGVDQTTPVELPAAIAVGVTANPSPVVTSIANNAWAVDTLAIRLNSNATTAQTLGWSDQTGGGPPGGVRGAGSMTGPVSPPGPVSMGWTTAAQDWAHIAAILRPAGGGLVVWREL